MWRDEQKNGGNGHASRTRSRRHNTKNGWLRNLRTTAEEAVRHVEAVRRAEAEHVEAEHVEAIRHAEAEHIEAEHIEAEHIEAEHAEAEHVEAEHAEAEHVEAEHAEAEHVEAEHAEACKQKLYCN